jgi:hypothetical protein
LSDGFSLRSALRLTAASCGSLSLPAPPCVWAVGCTCASGGTGGGLIRLRC